MASPEQRGKVIFYLGLTSAFIALATVVGTGAANHRVPEAAATSTPSDFPEKNVSNGVLNEGTAPENKHYSDGTHCTVVMFTRDNQLQYVTVPDGDAERIQEEVNRGDFRSIDNPQFCGEKGFIHLQDGVTAGSSVPAVPQQEVSSDNANLVREQLNQKAIGDIFEVVDKDGSVYRVQKSSASQFDVLEVIEDHKNGWLDPAERKTVKSHTIRVVR